MKTSNIPKAVFVGIVSWGILMVGWLLLNAYVYPPKELKLNLSAEQIIKYKDWKPPKKGVVLVLKKYPVIINEDWNKEAIKDLIANSKYPDILDPLVKCESQYISVARIDSNNLYSRGILQFQKATWNAFSKQGGITGDPMNPPDAIKMWEWAYEQGLLRHWSCARLLGFVK